MSDLAIDTLCRQMHSSTYISGPGRGGIGGQTRLSTRYRRICRTRACQSVVRVYPPTTWACGHQPHTTLYRYRCVRIRRSGFHGNTINGLGDPARSSSGCGKVAAHHSSSPPIKKPTFPCPFFFCPVSRKEDDSYTRMHAQSEGKKREAFQSSF